MTEKTIPTFFCTSTDCQLQKNNYCHKCSHAIYEGEVNVPGIYSRFEFSPRFGYSFVKKNGDEMVRVPGEKHPVWDAVEVWRKNNLK